MVMRSLLLLLLLLYTWAYEQCSKLLLFLPVAAAASCCCFHTQLACVAGVRRIFVWVRCKKCLAINHAQTLAIVAAATAAVDCVNATTAATAAAAATAAIDLGSFCQLLLIASCFALLFSSFLFVFSSRCFD